jgi:uncharacterized membrane protein
MAGLGLARQAGKAKGVPDSGENPRYNKRLSAFKKSLAHGLDAAACCSVQHCNISTVSNPIFRFATVSGQGIHWFLRRNCSVTPTQLGWMYASLCAVSLGIGLFFWFQGARFVLPFAWLELMAVGVAFLVYARHATDGERISLEGARLVVELENAGKLERAEFRREWVRIEPSADEKSLIAVSAQGRTVNVGRYVRPELRPLLAREIRAALRGA